MKEPNESLKKVLNGISVRLSEFVKPGEYYCGERIDEALLRVRSLRKKAKILKGYDKRESDFIRRWLDLLFDYKLDRISEREIIEFIRMERDSKPLY